MPAHPRANRLFEQELASLLDRVQAQYKDISIVTSEEHRVSIRGGIVESSRRKEARVIARAVERNYGISSSDFSSLEDARACLEEAARRAAQGPRELRLKRVKPEQGEVVAKYEVREEEMEALGRELELLLRQLAGPYYRSSELSIYSQYVDRELVTSEGTSIREAMPFTDLVVNVVVRDMAEGSSSQVVGGMGGLEAVSQRPWPELLGEMVRQALDAARGRLLSPLLRGSRMQVILDGAAAASLAHELAHLLEGGVRAARDWGPPEGFELIDNPCLPNAYGYRVWDDEGVRAQVKTLLSPEEHNALHTRLTAGEQDEPGNARGLEHVPIPLFSNVYIRPGDWRRDEILQETRRGLLVKGVIRAEVDMRDGHFELIPEVAYLVEKGELKAPIRNVKVGGYVREVVRSVSAVGKVVQMRPNLEKGFRIGEGAPYIRVDAMRVLS